jgi:Flp pilus assembly protein TadD
LGQALAADGQIDLAVRESREAIRLEPVRAEFHGDLASVLYRAGDRAGAIAELREAIRSKPAEASAAKWHYNLAAMLNESGRPGDAVRELEAALALDPSHEDARRALAQLRGR